jgi:hypothetical protein
MTDAGAQKRSDRGQEIGLNLSADRNQIGAGGQARGLLSGGEVVASQDDG